jgi:fido (protein-threonine AMPylation protein)
VDTAPLRTTSAWARAGRERYAHREDLPPEFEACLAEATDPAVPLPSRAARTYLDVVHFHPFADGNARPAMLALYFVLAHEGPRGAEGLAGFVAVLTEQTRHRRPTARRR